MLVNRYGLCGSDRFSREMNDLMNTVMDVGRPYLRRVQAMPLLNVWEDGDRLVAEAELPGLTMDDVEIFVNGDELTIKGRRPKMQDRDVTYHRRERGTTEFSRVLTLPVEIESGEVSATLKDGVLTVVLPKAASARPRKIPVTAE
jgi:HSP20 family protein